MGRFMQKRMRNKDYYKLGKIHNFYINELVMYRNQVPASMLDDTYLGPARIIHVSHKGAVLRDIRNGDELSLGFEHLRKLNFDELLTLLPQNFDAEIAESLGHYRYRNVSWTDETKNDDNQPKENVNEHLSERKMTRSGKIYNVKLTELPDKYRNIVRACTVRMCTIPKIVPDMTEKPGIPILKKRCATNYIKTSTLADFKTDYVEWPKRTLDKIDRYMIDNTVSTLRSDKECTKELILNGNKPPGRVKFGKVTVYFYDK
jgi:hypothetical protein